jgi:hypothetical protein
MEDRLCLSSTTILPISAFLAQQGHDMVFTPPARDQLAFSNSIFDPGTATPTSLGLVDFTGQEAEYLLSQGIDLHTAVTGFVTETPIAGTNLMEVSVNLEVRNALTWVVDLANANPNQQDAVNTEPLELGYRVRDLVANPSLTPALSSGIFQMTWVQQVGSDLPDLPRLNENFAMFAPPGFSFERFNIQSWGTGILRAASPVGTPGQTAIVATSQVADLTNPNFPLTLGDGFLQEPIYLVPLASPTAHEGYLNGTLFVLDTSNANDTVRMTSLPNGSVNVSSNLGSGSFPHVNTIVTALGGGTNNVQIGSVPNASVIVTGLDGNNTVNVGKSSKLVVHVGGGSNRIQADDASQGFRFIGVGGNGNNSIDLLRGNTSEVLLAGNGSNHINAAGKNDFLEVLGNGNNFVTDSGTGDIVWIGGDGNNSVSNLGTDSFTVILAGTGNNQVGKPKRPGKG